MVADEISIGMERRLKLYLKDGCIIEQLIDEVDFMNGKAHLFMSGI